MKIKPFAFLAAYNTICFGFSLQLTHEAIYLNLSFLFWYARIGIYDESIHVHRDKP